MNTGKFPIVSEQSVEMKELKGGRVKVGSNEVTQQYPEDGEYPQIEVQLKPFAIDVTEVTNAQFSNFVDSTHHVTDAEKYGWSFVFSGSLNDDEETKKKRQYVASAPWWVKVDQAYWFQPEGPKSTILSRLDHPVVHVSWNDAFAFCKWAKKRLPSEAEWEHAARGGGENVLFTWGNDDFSTNSPGEAKANIWQGVFPVKNTAEDGYNGTAPVRSYEPNPYQLYDLAGNVWEWVQDWFTRNRAEQAEITAQGPREGVAKVEKGGSYMCHKSYCYRYRITSRINSSPDSSSGNLGFRCARDVKSE